MLETKDENSEQDAELDGLSLCAFFQEKKSLPADTAYFLLTFQGFPLPIFFFSSKKGRTSTTVTVCSIFRLSFPNCRTPLFVEFDAPNICFQFLIVRLEMLHFNIHPINIEDFATRIKIYSALGILILCIFLCQIAQISQKGEGRIVAGFSLLF